MSLRLLHITICRHSFCHRHSRIIRKRIINSCCNTFYYPLFYDQTSKCRYFAIYAVGGGWTGAMTRKHILKNIPGHFDEDYATTANDTGGGILDNLSLVSTTGTSKTNEEDDTTTSTSANGPVLIYPYDDIQQVSAGWGSTAYIDTKGSLYVVGRPHDLISLLRMNRMPRIMQRWINQNHDISKTTPVGNAISNLIGWATGNEDRQKEQQSSTTWEIAKQYSFLHDWTKINFHSAATITCKDSRMKQVVCGPGFMAIVGQVGTLYTMGINNRGQCGVGIISNNVWRTTPVHGLSSSTMKGVDKDDAIVEQEHPIIQVALGFQHGYALSNDGRVFSWGKGSRGQLGREIDSDQDPIARSITIITNDGMNDPRVVQISAGHHHGALLTDDQKVYVWGKNMSRNNSSKDQSDKTEPSDARRPELVVGLPRDEAGEEIKVQQISCGSHHTAMLLEDGSIYATGIASDEAIPILEPVCLIPAGILELPIRQFEAHHDRTTAIDNHGSVYQAHLWNDETLRDYAYFTPSYVDLLLDKGQMVQSIHRGWRHTIIVTKPCSG